MLSLLYRCPDLSSSPSCNTFLINNCSTYLGISRAVSYTPRHGPNNFVVSLIDTIDANMRHEEGIEVILRPNGDEGVNTKLREIPLEPDQRDAQHKRCVVYKTPATFSVVIRFKDNFDMGSASALSVAIGMSSSDPKLGLDYWIVDRARRDIGQDIILKYLGGSAFSFTAPSSKTLLELVQAWLRC